MMQLLTSRSLHTHDDEQESLCAAHSHSGVQSRNITNTRIAYLRVCVCVLKVPICFKFSDILERCYLRLVHNCVYFAVKVLENQFQ